MKMNNSWNIQKLNGYIGSRNEKPNEVKVLSGEIPIISKIEFNTGKIYLREDGKSNTQLIKILPNDLVLSGINASKGAISLNNCHQEIAATIHYSAYYPKENKCDITFMWYYFKSNIFQNILKDNLPGGIKTEIKPKHILPLEIPLPPLEEQKRIVAKLKNIENNIKKIKELIKIQEREINHFRESYFQDLQKRFSNEILSELLISKREKVEIIPDQEYQQVKVKMYHKGIQLRKVIIGNQIGSKQFLANEGDFILSKIDARNGAMGIIPEELDNSIVTNDFPLFKFSEDINSKYFDYFSKTHFFDRACKNASEGSTNRRRIKMNKFKQIQIPLPLIEEQNKIVEMFEKLNNVKKKHEATLKELEDLFSSLLDKAFKGEI